LDGGRNVMTDLSNRTNHSQTKRVKP
jgi:hypothetical protein